jgi:hypothetical protein
MLLWNDALTAEADRITADFRAALQADDGTRAMDFGWQALAMEPLRPDRYFLLAAVNDETGGIPDLGKQLRALGLEAMLAQETIGEAQRMSLARAFPNWRGDWGDPERLEEEADTLRSEVGIAVEAERRLEPFEFLREFLAGVRRGMRPITVARVVQDAPGLRPVLAGAVRNGMSENSGVRALPLAMLVALQGAVGGAAVMPDLVKIAGGWEDPLEVHAEWALSQLAKRYPIEALAAMAAAKTGTAKERLIAANVLIRLDRRDGVGAALKGLAEGFADIAGEVCAGELAVTLERALRKRGERATAIALREAAEGHLEEEERDEYDMMRGMGDDFDVEIDEDFRRRSLEQVLVGRVLVDGETDWEELERPYEPPVGLVPETFRRMTPKIGRNDPCWCGSGKK